MTDATDPSAAEGGRATGRATATEPRHALLHVPVPELPGLDEFGQPRVVFGFRRVGGETVAEGFTSPALLVEARGPAQAWVAYPVADAVAVLATAGASVLVVDPGVDGGAVGLDLTDGLGRAAGVGQPGGVRLAGGVGR